MVKLLKSQKLWKTLGAAMIGYTLLVYLVVLLPWGPRIGNECLPEWLQGKRHDDYYVRWTRWLPRAATSWCIRSAPLLLLGNQKSRALALDGTSGPKPVPDPGEWQFSIIQLHRGWPFVLPYLAWTTQGGIHFRFGARWDDVDHYYTFPSIAIAKPGTCSAGSVPLGKAGRIRPAYIIFRTSLIFLAACIVTISADHNPTSWTNSLTIT